MRAKSSTIALICTLLIATAPTANAQYRYPRNDLELVVRYAHVSALAEAFRNAGYAFTYHNNGTVCSSPNVSAVFGQIVTNPKSVYDLTNGTVNTRIATAVSIRAEISHCTFKTVKASAACTGDLPLIGPAGANVDGKASCNIDVDGKFTLGHDIVFKLPYPLALPPQIAFRLPPQTSSNGLVVKAAFAESVSGRWQPLAAPQDHERSWPLSGYGAFADPKDDLGDPSRHAGTGSFLTLAATVTHAPSVADTPDAKEALARTAPASSMFENDPDALALLRVHESLLGSRTTSGEDARHGLLGSLFPLIVNASYTLPVVLAGISASVVIEGITVKLGERDGRPTIDATLHLDRNSFHAEAAGLALPVVVPSDVAVQIDAPHIDDGGHVRIDFSEIDLTLEAKVAKIPVPIAIGGALREILNAALPNIATVESAIEVRPPDCIDAGNERVEALSPCQSRQGRKTKLMNHDGGGAAANLFIDTARTSVVARDGEMDLQLFAKRR